MVNKILQSWLMLYAQPSAELKVLDHLRVLLVHKNKINFF